ncbi:c-type cytochrome [Paraburkholderia aromaticivorans]|nr:cytochrome c [Paraburkholderia aromaticivorans]
MKRVSSVLLNNMLAALLLGGMGLRAAQAAGPFDADIMAKGQAVYTHYCAVCHALGVENPGTFALAKYYGMDKAALVQRDNLTVDFVRYLVRNGRGLMPAFRPAEISNQELDALSRYLAAGPHVGLPAKNKN